jgi:hypothetical protein
VIPVRFNSIRILTACPRGLIARFAGQTVGVKQVDERIWLVSFMHYDLGFIDLEQRTLQPLDNPFGPGLSPLS